MKRFVAIALLLFGSFSLFAQQWEIEYGGDGNYTRLIHGLTNAKGEAVMMGSKGVDDNSIYPMIICVDSEGNFTEKVFEVEELFRISPVNIIQLDNGYYLVSATDLYQHMGRAIEFIILDENLDVVSIKHHDIKPENAISISAGRMLQNPDGTVTVSGMVRYDSPLGIGWAEKPYFLQLDANMDTIACRFVPASSENDENDINYYNCQQLFRNPSDDGYVIISSDGGLNGGPSILLYDSDFNYVDGHLLWQGFEVLFEEAYSDTWLSDDELFVMCSLAPNHTYPQRQIALSNIKLDGTINRIERICTSDEITFQCLGTTWMKRVNDTTFYGTIQRYKDFFVDQYFKVVLFDKDMELLGQKDFDSEEYANYFSLFILSFSDGGCVFAVEDFLDSYNYGKIIKMSREDFNPIPCSVSKIPKEQLEALAFPNPASDEIHFDISSLPVGKEHRISISDAMGRLVMSRIIRGEGNVLTVGIADFKPGFYTYCIFNSQATVVNGKFVKE